jgi:hypothetical protein
MALHVAVLSDDIVAMQVLLESCWECSPWSETTRGGVTPLLLACEKGRLAAVQLLLTRSGSNTLVGGLNPLILVLEIVCSRD